MSDHKTVEGALELVNELAQGIEGIKSTARLSPAVIRLGLEDGRYLMVSAGRTSSSWGVPVRKHDKVDDVQIKSYRVVPVVGNGWTHWNDKVRRFVVRKDGTLNAKGIKAGLEAAVSENLAAAQQEKRDEEDRQQKLAVDRKIVKQLREAGVAMAHTSAVVNLPDDCSATLTVNSGKLTMKLRNVSVQKALEALKVLRR